MQISNDLKKQGLNCARKIADWYWHNQSPHYDYNPSAGCAISGIDYGGTRGIAHNWQNAFAVMGLLAAYKVFDERKYYEAACNMGRYLKSLQIFSPFLPQHHGAIRELTPQTPWCYTRDSESTAWSFLVLSEHTQDREYLERARLWGEWFLKNGLDEEGWPLWGVQFEPYFKHNSPQMCLDIQGCFQGGGLGFLYHLGRLTKDSKWTGPTFVRIADHLVNHIQQADGLFRSIERSTHRPPPNDPQGGLHRTNDDFNTLGLLAAHRVTGDKKYLEAIERFLNGVFKLQKPDGAFDKTITSIPLILNTLYECGESVKTPSLKTGAVEKAMTRLLAAQDDGTVDPNRAGGLIEDEEKLAVNSRSSGYALIVLLKLCAGCEGFLAVHA